MNSQETLWFIGKCLSLAVHTERTGAIKEVLESGKVNWNSLVYQSSNQLVLPALYLNLKRNNLLVFLPNDLVAHLEDITNQNRDRNKAILNHVEEITLLFRANGLEPIFLKGTAHLLDGLYEDIAERMLSDIDLLLDQDNALKAWGLLKDSGYYQLPQFGDIKFDRFRHLPALIKDNSISSVEVHRRLLEGDYDHYFNWSNVKDNLKKSNSAICTLVLSDKDLILHNILNVQMNDNAGSMYKILLRQSYDLMLLSKRKNPLDVIKDFEYYLKKLNGYIALSASILDNPKGLDFENSTKIKRHIKHIKLLWKYPEVVNFFAIIYFILFRIYRYITQFFLFFIRSSVRKRIMTSLKNPDYYKAHWGMYKKWFT